MALATIEKTVEKKRSFYPYYIAIVILSFVFYGNSLKNKYSMDDNLVTSTYSSQHPLVEKGILGIPKIFTSHYAVNAKQSYAYRPVTTSSFAIEYQFFGQAPAVSHLFNVLLYALAIIILFRLLNQMWGEEKYILTALSCLIFLIHPIHSEVVNNIKSRDELLSMLFGLLAIKHTLNYFDKNKGRFIVYVILLIALSLLSKKTGMVFLAIIPLTLYYFRTLNLKKIGLIACTILAGFVVYRLFGKLLLDDTVARKMLFFENPLFYSGFSERIPMFFYTNFYYLSLLLYPYPLRYYYGFDQVPIADWSYPMVYVMLIVMTISVGLALWRIKKKELWAYAVLFYFLAIGGACNLLFPAVGIIAERFAYVGSIGFSLLVAIVIYHFFFDEQSKFKSRRVVTKITLGMLSLSSFVYVYDRNSDWETDVSLYKNDLPYLERSVKANNMLAQAYFKDCMAAKQNNHSPQLYAAKVDSTEMLFRRCISIYNQYSVTYNNLGALLYSLKGEEDSAYYYFNKAIELDSNYTEALYNLGNIEADRFYAYYYLHSFTHEIVDSDNPLLNEATLSKFESSLSEVGKTLLILKNNLPAIINQAGTQSQSQQDFLVNLRNFVIGFLTTQEVIQYFDQNEFNEKFLTNGQGIIDSYQSGYLNQHLYNFIAKRIAENAIDMNQNLSNVNRSSIAEFCQNKKELYQQLFLKHIGKSLELSPSYYPSFQKLNQYYYDLLDYDNIINLNEQIVTSGTYPYQYEFHNNIAKAYFFKSDYQSCKTQLELTLLEIDRYMKEIPAEAGKLVQYKLGVKSQLDQVNLLLNNPSN